MTTPNATHRDEGELFTEQLLLRFRRADFADIKQAAERDHRRPSDWARAKVLQALKDAVVERVEMAR